MRGPSGLETFHTKQGICRDYLNSKRAVDVESGRDSLKDTGKRRG